MIRVCIIGGIGSGKTSISRLFRFPVFNADKEVKFIYKNNKSCFRNLRSKLPKFIKSYPIKKKDLISAINDNEKNLKKISSVVHPIVRKRLRNFIKKNNNYKMIILDIPLLIENKINNKKDFLVFVDTNRNNILRRLKQRPNFNKKIFNKLRENQIELSEKKKLADYIIDNNYPVHIIKKKIKKLKEKILNERNNT